MSLLLALSIGCASGPYGAPAGASIEVLEYDEGPIFDVAYNDPDDGIGLLIREQLLVTIEDDSRSTELPLNNILVEVTSGWSAAYLISTASVSLVEDYDEECKDDGSEDCAAWFDIGTDEYYAFAGEYTDLGGLRPTYYRGGTDNRGILEVYVFVDSIPYDDDGEVIPIPLFASIGVDTVSWSYDFQ